MKISRWFSFVTVTLIGAKATSLTESGNASIHSVTISTPALSSRAVTRGRTKANARGKGKGKGKGRVTTKAKAKAIAKSKGRVRGKTKSSKYNSSGHRVTGKDVEIDCSSTADYKYQACNTICAASICLEHTDATGLWIKDGQHPIKKDPLVYDRDAETKVRDPGDGKDVILNNRMLSGCYKRDLTMNAMERTQKNKGWHMKPADSSSKSPDEWPPNKSRSGGPGALVQIIREGANKGVGNKLPNNIDGYVVLNNVLKSGADVCKTIINDGQTKARQDFCNGKDERFAQWKWSGKKYKGEFRPAGELTFQNYLKPLQVK